ncbi:MAG: threonine synthase, partial [Oscillospiraceae bacterium]
ASNSNNVLTDFINTGVYNKNREFYQTISPSMDILISSNLERLLYFMSENNSEYINEIFNQLNINGKYKINNEIFEKIKNDFYGGYCTDEDTVHQIKKKFNETGYLMDSHTAVADCVYEKYKDQTKDNTKTVIVSTASPYKFSASVLKAIDNNFNINDDEFTMTDKINLISGLEIPTQLKQLKEKEIIFKDIITKDEMENSVYNILRLK